jgi:ferrochelatase
MKNTIGLLITNIGSPDQPTPPAVRMYLKKFLSDPRVIEIPKIAWLPILYGIILPLRSKKSAQLYQKIWTDQGSPLTYLSQQIATKLQKQLQIPVALGMHYGKPSIEEGLRLLHHANVNKIIVLPLFPQYSATSTAATFDHVAKILKQYRDIPDIHFLHDYATHPNYIETVSHSIQQDWTQQNKPEHLLFSFHGIPKRNITLGDPYQNQCQLTAELIAEKLQLNKNEWSIAYQSRLGRAKWLTPYTDHILKELPTRGITNIHVVCPGFAVDCLETLEEIAIRGKKQFLQAGGKEFHYIPALNDHDAHIKMLERIIHELTMPML